MARVATDENLRQQLIEGGHFVPTYAQIVSMTPQEVLDEAQPGRLADIGGVFGREPARRSVVGDVLDLELFFLDEATAFAAGHRPCAECRNADYKRFRALWERCFGGPAYADAVLRLLTRLAADPGSPRAAPR